MQKIQNLEKQLRKALKTRDPSIELLRQELRTEAVSTLLSTKDLSVDSILWKTCHYKKIEEFRSSLKQLKGEAYKTKLAEFRYFLADATGFYLELVEKICLQFGIHRHLLESLNLLQDGFIEKQEDSEMTFILHKLLIYLGDLARYRQMYSDLKKDYRLCQTLYSFSSSLVVTVGHPLNQLAVVYGLQGMELESTLYYIKSLCVETPFSTSLDNLKQSLYRHVHSNASTSEYCREFLAMIESLLSNGLVSFSNMSPHVLSVFDALHFIESFLILIGLMQVLQVKDELLEFIHLLIQKMFTLSTELDWIVIVTQWLLTSHEFHPEFWKSFLPIANTLTMQGQGAPDELLSQRGFLPLGNIPQGSSDSNIARQHGHLKRFCETCCDQSILFKDGVYTDSPPAALSPNIWTPLSSSSPPFLKYSAADAIIPKVNYPIWDQENVSLLDCPPMKHDCL